MKNPAIPEYLLREVWKDHTNFLVEPLRLTDESTLRIIDPGLENEHRGGPDFLAARFSIGDVAISGDVELHLTPNHWDAHHHDTDLRYAGVALHVVMEQDDNHDHRDVLDVPTLVLRDNLAFDRKEIWTKLFERVYDRSPELKCFPHNLQVPMRFKRLVLEKFGAARLEELVDRVLLDGINELPQDRLIERVYQLTMDALGYSQNRVPFRELSSLLPLSRLRYIRKELLRSASTEQARLTFEALYFGAAGLLPNVSDEFDAESNEYLMELRAIWHSLLTTFAMPETLIEADWAFFRIRPNNSPYRRLALAAQLAQIYFSHSDWNFGQPFFFEGPRIDNFSSPFWQHRTSFAQALTEPQSLLGEERRTGIWLNVILPSQIARLRQEADSTLNRNTERRLIKEWGDSRTKSSAKYLKLISQELLESETVNSVRSEQGGLILVRNFCEKNRCYECPIGNRLKEKGWKL